MQHASRNAGFSGRDQRDSGERQSRDGPYGREQRYGREPRYGRRQDYDRSTRPRSRERTMHADRYSNPVRLLEHTVLVSHYWKSACCILLVCLSARGRRSQVRSTEAEDSGYYSSEDLLSKQSAPCRPEFNRPQQNGDRRLSARELARMDFERSRSRAASNPHDDPSACHSLC